MSLAPPTETSLPLISFGALDVRLRHQRIRRPLDFHAQDRHGSALFGGANRIDQPGIRGDVKRACRELLDDRGVGLRMHDIGLNARGREQSFFDCDVGRPTVGRRGADRPHDDGFLRRGRHADEGERHHSRGIRHVLVHRPLPKLQLLICVTPGSTRRSTSNDAGMSPSCCKAATSAFSLVREIVPVRSKKLPLCRKS